jgi:uncharacterized C2H2 Zn-finger protein
MFLQLYELLIRDEPGPFHKDPKNCSSPNLISCSSSVAETRYDDRFIGNGKRQHEKCWQTPSHATRVQGSIAGNNQFAESSWKKISKQPPRDSMISPNLRVNCPLCSVTFSRKYGMYRHIQIRHTNRNNSNEHKCHVCYKVFTRRDVLTRHGRTAHGITVTEPAGDSFPYFEWETE